MLFERLEWLVLQPRVILDLGCGWGRDTLRLQALYPDARVIGIDKYVRVLDEAKQNNKVSFMTVDAMALPFADHSVDMIYANLLLPWCDDWKAVVREWRRVLRPEGVLFFSTLGPDTLKLLQPTLIDMHDLGDALLQEGLSDPVMDAEYVTLRYRSATQLQEELQDSDMLRLANRVFHAQHDKDGVYPLTFEVILGHAFGAPETHRHTADHDGVVRIPLSALRSSLAKK